MTSEFEATYGVTYRAHLRDGDDFTGRARRVARRLGLAQDKADDALFAAFGGRDLVRESLLIAWRDPSRKLDRLNAAEVRLMLMMSIDAARTAPVSVVYIDELVGHGVFADQPIRAGEVIGEYTGVLRKVSPADYTNHYLANTPAYGRLDGFIIDGRDEGNVTRFINHSYQVPNVSNHVVFHAKRWHRVLRADRAITPGEQILWDYGEDYWRQREAPADL